MPFLSFDYGYTTGTCKIDCFSRPLVIDDLVDVKWYHGGTLAMKEMVTGMVSDVHDGDGAQYSDYLFLS